MNITKTYKIPHLECPECALGIVERLEGIAFVDELYIDYDAGTLTVIGDKALGIDQINQIIAFITENEHDISHQYKNIRRIITDEFVVENIDCANCALKVERALNKNDNIVEAQVNLVSKKIIIKHLGNVEIYNVVSNIVSRVNAKAQVTNEQIGESKLNHQPQMGPQLLLLSLIIGCLFFVVAIILTHLTPHYKLGRMFYIIAYVILTYDIVITAIKEIISREFFNENILMIIASVGAMVINENIEGILVILLFKIGEFFQEKATKKSRNAIQGLINVEIDKAMLKDGSFKSVKEVGVGEIITVRVGERIPLDGIVKKGETNLDMKTLTGESKPHNVKVGEPILSGAINLTKVIDIEVTKRSDESTLAKVKKLVEEAAHQKSRSEKFITKFARVYTPIILGMAILIGLFEYYLLQFSIQNTLNNVFTILVISCPCALVISIPLGYFSAIGRASAEGILIKGGNYLESLTKVEMVIFDKTGTITKGNFKVTQINPSAGFSEKEVLEIMALGEQYSLHPIATAIKDAYKDELTHLEDYVVEEISGAGLKVKSENRLILIGNDKLMELNSIEYNACFSEGTVVYVSVNSEFCGSVVIEDELKEHSVGLMAKLKESKISTLMLTGDSANVARKVSTKLNINEFHAGLLPHEKYEIFKQKLIAKKGNIVYVGDGINDTPALKLADVGIAMGALGSDSAKECADVVIMNDDIYKVYSAIEIAKYTKKIVTQNIIFAVMVKIVALIIGTLGILKQYGMIGAIFADVGVCLIVILNVIRITKKKFVHPNKTT